MSTAETIPLLPSSSSKTELSKCTTPTDKSSSVSNLQTGDEKQPIDFIEFGLPADTICGRIEHSNSKIQEFIRFRFRKDDYNKREKKGESEGNNSDSSKSNDDKDDNKKNASNGDRNNDNQGNNSKENKGNNSKDDSNDNNTMDKNDGNANGSNKNDDDSKENNNDNNNDNNKDNNSKNILNGNSNNDSNNNDNNKNDNNNNNSNEEKDSKGDENTNDNNDSNNNKNSSDDNNEDNNDGNTKSNDKRDDDNDNENNNENNNNNTNKGNNSNSNLNGNSNNDSNNNDNNKNDNNNNNNSNEEKDSNGDENTNDNNDSNNDKNSSDDSNEDNNDGNANSNDTNDDNDDNENDEDSNKDNSCYTKLGKVLYKFITEYWNVDPPEYVLSLVGDSQNLPSNTLRNIISSLKAITRIKGSWNIGKAVNYSDNANACGEGNKDNKNICIGFVDGGYFRESRMVKVSDDPTKYKFETKTGYWNLNPSYTHIIIVDDIDSIYRLQTAFTCFVDGFSFLIPIHGKDSELYEIACVSDYSEIVKEANKQINLILLDHDEKDKLVLNYARRSRWKLLDWDGKENKEKDKELERMITKLYKKEQQQIKKKYGFGLAWVEEDYENKVKITYKQTMKFLKTFRYPTSFVSTKSDHIFQHEILQKMWYCNKLQSICLAMAWEMEDASYRIDTYYEKHVNNYKKEEDDQNNKKKIEEFRRDMLLASLFNGKLKHVQHVMKVFGIPKLTKHFLADLYNASILVHKPCVDWQEYSVADHSLEIKDYFDLKGEGEGDDDGNNSGDSPHDKNDVSGGENTYSAINVYETCLSSNIDYTKFKTVNITEKDNLPDNTIDSEENHSKALSGWRKVRKMVLPERVTFPNSIIDINHPSKALVKWAVLHSLDDIALQLLQTGTDFKHQLELLLVAVAIIFRLRRNAQELKTGEEVCVKRLQRYSNICRVFMETSYEEGMRIDVDDINVKFALENRDVFGQEFVEDFASSEAVQESIQEKWKGYKVEENCSDKGSLCTVYKNCDTPQTKFYVHSLFYFVFLTFLSYLSIMKWPTISDKSRKSHLDLYSVSTLYIFCAVYSLLYVISYIGMEIKQFCDIMKRFKGDPWYGARSYLFDKWNVLDLLCILFFIAVIPLVFTFHTYEVGRVMLAVDVSFWILRILQILKYLEKTGMWIEMLWRMFLDMLKFLIILVIFLFAFGIAMMAMRYQGTDFFESVVKKPYFTIYGEFFLDDLEEVKDPLVRPISIVYVGVYLLVANVLVLNVLIAVFNDSYNNVKATGTKIWKLSRYDLLQEYRTRPILPPPFTIFELIINLFTPTSSDKNIDPEIDELLTQKSWMDDRKTKKGDKKTEISPGGDSNTFTLNDDTSGNDGAQRCLSVAIEQVPDDSSELSNYEVKAQLIKKLDEQQKRSDEQKKESNDEFKDQLGKRLEEQLKEATDKLEKRLDEKLKDQENKLLDKFDILLKHLKVEPVTDEQ